MAGGVEMGGNPMMGEAQMGMDGQQMGMGGVPPQMNMMNPQMMGDQAPHLVCLARQERVVVKEKVNVLEAITAMIGAEIDQANKYNIFGDGGEHELFYAVETTDCWSRYLKQCCPDCASWNLNVDYTENGANYTAYKIERPTTCTCLCFNRPKMTVTDVTSGKRIGGMSDPFACCDLTFTVSDENDNPAIKAKGGCCQWGLCCAIPCGPCKEVNFSLEDANTGEEIGHLQKKITSCGKALADADNYTVEFGRVSHPQWKALLLALTIFIDFRYFNTSR